MLEQAVDHLVRGIVEHPDDVLVDERNTSRGDVIEVRVAPDDLGRVIGRSGRTAQSLRTVVDALAGSRRVRVNIVDTDA
ncbi:RNA-binding protein [Pseudoclavibacter soli]|uniref:RNA-binding protein n=1 Tax=Pseudoclavibacter soli TaxID=452623 RepID=UPI0003F7CFB0|nr:RNA-binding protein [Pseudoclavibacter soli]